VSKKSKKEATEQKTPTGQEVEETISRLKGQLRVLGVASCRVNDGTIAMFSAEFLRRLAAEAEATPDHTALVFMKAVDL
jgi:hypothetical protein